jgi:hypothetical protein
MAAALTMVWGCSSSDDDKEDPNLGGENTISWIKANGSADNWKVNWSGQDTRPTWEAPSPRGFETWMILMVTLQPELAAYSSEEDLMAVTINNEVRAVSSPAISMDETNDVFFILKILGNETSEERVGMTLEYYCSKLHQTFILKGSQYFVPELVYGVDEVFIPDILSGCPNYPVTMPVSIKFPMAAEKTIKPKQGDLVAVLVGDECRGVATLDSSSFLSPILMQIYGRNEGETGIIYYYSASENTVWNTQQKITIAPPGQKIEVNL